MVTKPTKKFKVAPTKPPPTITVQESNALLDCFECPYGSLYHKAIGQRNKTIGLLMLDAGLRVGEVVQLLVSDLYLYGEPVKSLVVSPKISKSKAQRIIPLTERVKFELKGMAMQWWSKFHNGFCGFAFFNELPLQHISTRQVERFIAKAGFLVCSRKVTPHTLRHTFATRLMRTCNVQIVQQLLGHQHIATTQIYQHPNADDLKKAINGIEKGDTDAK